MSGPGSGYWEEVRRKKAEKAEDLANNGPDIEDLVEDLNYDKHELPAELYSEEELISEDEEEESQDPDYETEYLGLGE